MLRQNNMKYLHDVDFFERSSFVGNAVKVPVNEQIREAILKLYEKLRAVSADGTLMMTGSLARREPSLTFDNAGNPCLNSDIDCVFFTSERERARLERANLSAWIDQIMPPLELSMYFAPRRMFDNMPSVLGHDLVLASAAPLYGSPPPFPIKQFIPTRDRLFEVFVHQFSTFALTLRTADLSSIQYARNSMYRGTSAILQGLRYVVSRSHYCTFFSDLIKPQSLSRFEHIITLETIVSIILDREIYRGSCDQGVLRKVTFAVCAERWGVDLGMSPEKVVGRLTDSVASEDGITAAYQRVAMAFGIVILFEIIQEASVSNVLAGLNEFLSKYDVETSTGKSELIDIHLLMQRARAVFLEYLHVYNLGWPFIWKDTDNFSVIGPR